MSYDQGRVHSYSFGVIDFGAGDVSLSIQAPPIKMGRLVGMCVSCHGETFNSVTTEAQLQVGTAADPDAYGLLNIGDLADTDSISVDEDDDAIIDEAIPAGTQVEITCVAPTGGTPAGMADVHVAIEWY